MTSAQLKYFTTVGQLENLSKAAVLLHMSQSSLSKNIARLEAELGTTLFDRKGKKMTLNAAGEKFLEFSTKTLSELEKTCDNIRILSTGNDSRIKAGAAGAGGALINCISAFCREHPEAEFDINCNIESEEYIDINDLDVLVYPDSARYEKFSGYRLCEERCFLAASASDPISENISIQPKALNGLNFVFLRGKNTYVEYTMRLCKALAIQPGKEYFVDTRELHRQMISGGVAVGFVPEGSTAMYMNDPAIRLMPIHDRRFSREMMICFKREKHLSPLGREFRDFALEHFKLK